MNVEQHIAHRAWAFQSLEALDAFLADPDFIGDMDEEGRAIGRKRKELKDGKYRVVILGEFNVGKSALVNAFLGDEYLPMVLEECTAKITHIMRAEDMKVVLNLSSPATETELEVLSRLMNTCGVPADVIANEEMDQVVIAFPTNQPRDLVRGLRPLVMVSADDDFPQLHSLRVKFEEVNVQLPTDLLADDVALVDSPGVHSISETNTRLAEEIIPNSHLIICLLDSQNPATEHNRSFIEKVVNHRRRKVMFVINKADQLNDDEIDTNGRRGPAKDLLRSLRGVMEGPEIHFVSALYSLVSSQLFRSELTLEDLDNNNKIKIPWTVQRELMQCENPTDGVAQYLAEKSNIAPLRERLLRYLYTENREGALLESACRFIDDKAWTYARPIKVQLDMARDNPRLVELEAQRGMLSTEIAESVRRAEEVCNALEEMSAGGTVGGREYAGYERLIDSFLTAEAVQRSILDPAHEWICDDVNYRAAKQGGFSPLAAKVEILAEAFLQDVCEALNSEIDLVESTALDGMGRLCPANAARYEGIETPRVQLQELRTSLAGSYLGFALAGGVLCAAAGAGAVASGALAQYSVAPTGMNLQMAAGAGAAAGILAGLLLRAATAKSLRRKKLVSAIREQVVQFILGSGKGQAADRTPSLKEQLCGAARQRRAVFSGYVQESFEAVLADMRARLAEVVEEEDELRRKQEEIIARLEPKLTELSELGRKAAETAQAHAQRDTAVAT